MQLTELFYSWVPKYLRWFILLVLLFVTLCANGIYLGITTDMYSSLAVDAEPFTLGYNAMYIGMGISMMMYERLALRFSNKMLVVAGLFFILLMNIACAATEEPVVAVMASFLLGVGKVFALGEVYLAWLKIWSRKLQAARLYPFFYFVALGGLYFITWTAAVVARDFNWRYAYLFIIAVVLLGIVLTILFIENHPLKKKIPLYQLDLSGVFWISVSLMSVNYVAVYGKLEDWLASDRIKIALFTGLISILLFIRRELTVKRPFLDLDTFKHRNLLIGIGLFIMMGTMSPTTFQNVYTGSVLQLETYRNSEINLYLLPGILLGSVISFWWLETKHDNNVLIVAGFALFLLYHMLMYLQYTNDLNLQNFRLPALLKGAALAFLYTSTSLYATTGFQFPQLLKIVGINIIFRSFLGPGIFSGIYSYVIYSQRVRHLTDMASKTDSGQPFIFNIQQEAGIGALKEVTGFIILVGLAFLGVLLVTYIIQSVRAKKSPELLLN